MKEKKAKRATEKKEVREKNPGNPNRPRQATAKVRYHLLPSDSVLVPSPKDRAPSSTANRLVGNYNHGQ